MPHFLLTGKDGSDAEALNRRMANRPAHLHGAERMKESGHLLMGAAMLDPEGKMVGSVMIFNFESRQKLDEYLKTEPYVTGNVWQHIEIQDIAVASHFLPVQTVKA